MPELRNSPLDIIPAIKLQREIDHFLNRKSRSRCVAAHAVDAILAIVNAVIGQQDFQQRNAPAIGRVTMADADLGSVTELLAIIRSLRSRGCARGIVFSRVSKNRKFNPHVHDLSNDIPNRFRTPPYFLISQNLK